MTLGVRAIVHDKVEQSIFLVRHTYVPGWHLPGGGVEPGETAMVSLERELREEGNLEIMAPAELKSLHFNRSISRRDHVALYLVHSFRQTAPRLPDMEIAEAGFFPIDALPEGVTPATRRRLEETFDSRPVSTDW